MSEAQKSTSSTCNKSLHPSFIWPRRRHWIIGGVCAALVAALVTWTLADSSATPEIRVGGTERAVSALLVDGDDRILILNANGPQDARAVIGILSPPWEAAPSTVVVGADRVSPAALSEALQRLQPRQLIVAGAPGADPDWVALERFCRATGITVSYLDHEVEIALDAVTLTIVPTRNTAPSHLRVAFGATRVAVGLGGLPVGAGRFHLAISDRQFAPGSWSDVVVTSDSGDGAPAGRAIILRPGQRIDALIEPQRVRIQGRAAHIETEE